MGANAQTSVPAFTAGQILTAQQLFEISTGIPVFATTTTRDAAFGGTGEKTLAEGQFAYIEASNTTQYYDGTSWLSLGGKLGQVVSTIKSDTFTMASATYTDVTGLSVAITPTATSSKILVTYWLTSAADNASTMGYSRLVRDSTAIAVGDASSNRVQATTNWYQYGNYTVISSGVTYLDSPATTSSTTYKVQVRREAAAGTVYVNRGQNDTDNASGPRTVSTITVMEILA